MPNSEIAAIRNPAGFFAVDRRCWSLTCKLGLNAATAYLVLARGSGGDNRTTSWSVQAIEERTGISRHRAREAVNLLESAGLIRLDKAGSKPRRYIMPANCVPNCEGYQPPIPAGLEAWVKALQSGDALHSGRRCKDARLLVEVGIAKWSGANLVLASGDPDVAAKADWIWLPNALIDGAAAETPPVELLRQSQNLGALRLLIELYSSQLLWKFGGIDPHILTTKYKRVPLVEDNQWKGFKIWAFQSESRVVWTYKASFVQPFLTGKRDKDKADLGMPDFWRALKLLETTGLLELVPHVFESAEEEGEMIHPCPSIETDCGLAIERRLAQAANRLALAATELEPDASFDAILVPAAAHISSVAMRDVPRLRYRPHTVATSEWLGRSVEWEKWAERFEALADDVTVATDAIVALTRAG